MIGSRYSAMLAIASSVSGSLLVSPSNEAPMLQLLRSLRPCHSLLPACQVRWSARQTPCACRPAPRAMVADAAFRVAYPTYTARIAASAVVKHHGLGADCLGRDVRRPYFLLGVACCAWQLRLGRATARASRMPLICEEEQLGEVAGRPAGKPANKVFGTMRTVSPSVMSADRLAVLLGGQDRLAVPVAEAHGCLGGGQIEAKANAVHRGAAGEAKRGKRQGNCSDQGRSLRNTSKAPTRATITVAIAPNCSGSMTRPAADKRANSPA
jgi:hypothetical protein